MVRGCMAGDFHSELEQVNDKYGNLARIGPNDLLTNDHELIRRMNAVRSPYTRSSWYDGMRIDPERDHVFSVKDDKIHDHLRGMMAMGVRAFFLALLIDSTPAKKMTTSKAASIVAYWIW
jgi:hypothetical protein